MERHRNVCIPAVDACCGTTKCRSRMEALFALMCHDDSASTCSGNVWSAQSTWYPSFSVASFTQTSHHHSVTAPVILMGIHAFCLENPIPAICMKVLCWGFPVSEEFESFFSLECVTKLGMWLFVMVLVTLKSVSLPMPNGVQSWW